MFSFVSSIVEMLSNTHPFFDVVIAGVPLSLVVSLLLLFCALLFVFQIAQWFFVGHVRRLAEKTTTQIDDLILSVVATVRPGFYVYASLYVTMRAAGVRGALATVLNVLLVLWVVYQLVRALQVVIDYVVGRASENENNRSSIGAITLVGRIAKWTLWILAGLFVLSNVGVDISSFIAGLGIGGIAIALALQNILTDLFSSFAIFFDKPFQVGDFIVVGEQSGVVEKIGIKTTRMRALQGEEVVISNKELTSVRIQNFKKLATRRVVLSLGVTYDTSSKMLEEIPAIVQSVVEKEADVRFDRVHFSELGDSALGFELVYYVESSDYVVHMDRKQSILLGIVSAFNDKKIAFAFPSQTIYLEK